MSSDVTAARINEVRGNMSQDEFAKSIMSSQSVISKILSGDQSPSVSVLIQIAKTYGVSIDWLLGLSSRKSLKGYSSFDDTNPSTYADAIAFFVELLKKNSIVYERISEDAKDYHYRAPQKYMSEHCIYILDGFIGELISSISPLVKSNPESIDSMLSSLVSKYDIQILEWNDMRLETYWSSIRFMTPLRLLEKMSGIEHKEE